MPRFIKFYDANRTQKNYPIYRLKPKETLITSATSMFDILEAKIVYLDDENTVTYTFSKTYTEIPVCVATPTENANIYIEEITNTYVVLTTSENFTGYIHIHLYKAN